MTSEVGVEEINVIQKVNGLFGAGDNDDEEFSFQLRGSNCRENTFIADSYGATLMHKDFVADMSADMYNTDAFKVYHGLDALCEWTHHVTTNIKFRDFETLSLASDGKGTVFQYLSYAPEGILSGKKAAVTSSVLAWTIKDGKAVSLKTYWGDAGIMDKLYVNPDVAAVSEVFKSWGGGKYHGPGCLANMKKSFREDAVFDATGLSPHTDGLKRYEGVEEICAWTKYLEEYDMTTYKVEGLYPRKGYNAKSGTVLQKGSFLPKVVSTGKTADMRIDEYIQWNIEDGMIVEAKRYAWNLGLADALFD
jgi:hypothetical protein